jgi:hypothetical protein
MAPSHIHRYLCFLQMLYTCMQCIYLVVLIPPTFREKYHVSFSRMLHVSWCLWAFVVMELIRFESNFASIGHRISSSLEGIMTRYEILFSIYKVQHIRFRRYLCSLIFFYIFSYHCCDCQTQIFVYLFCILHIHYVFW